MAILRNAFVKVLPDTSRFDRELKDKLRNVKADEPAEKIGKAFSSTLTRRIDRELKKFDLPTLELKGNPRDAVKAIETAQRRLEKLRDDADDIELRIRANKALGDLGRFRKQVGDVGEESAKGFVARFGASVGPLMASMPLGSGAAAAGTALGVAMAPTIGATVAGAVVGGVGAGGVIGGLVLAGRDARVQAAGKSLGAFILDDLTERADAFVPVMLDGIDDVRAGWRAMGPDLDRIFASSRFVDPLVAGTLSGTRRIVAGVADVMDEAEPAVNALGAAFDRIGDAVGDTFSLLAEDADEGASAVTDLTVAVSNFIRVSGGLVHALAQVKGYTDDLDVALDRGRYFLEDYDRGLIDIGVRLDLTADGFSRGSAEAEAYRKATLGTADAADFATLKLAGMTDAEIQAADASGTFRLRTDEVNAALGKSSRFYVDTRTEVEKLDRQTQLLGEVQTVAAQQMEALLTKTGAVTGAMDAQRTMADLLRQAHERMYGATINANEANEGYESSWDRLSGSVERNGRSLSINTEKGRDNRDALQELLGRTNDLFYAEIETGSSVEAATKKHEDRIKAVKEEARRLGLNKTETEKLIETYGKIPPDKSTNIMLEGIQAIGKTLTDLYIFQRSLATGRTLAQVRSDLFGGYAGDPRVFKADGGPIPGHSPSDTADNIPVMATADEYMIRRSSARKLGRPVLDYINAHGELPRGYAQGGSIGRLAGKDWGRQLKYPVDLSETYVMSRREAASKVIAAPPAGGATAPWMVNVLRQAFPALSLISGFRPGSRTLSGSLSYHALNRAVDYPPNRQMARWVFSNYRAKTREFISPFQEYNLLNGRPHRYTGAVWQQHNWAGGNAHNHWAMDNGGYLAPGWNPPIYNGTGRPEPVTPAPIMDKVIDELRGIRKDLARLPVYQVPDAGRVAGVWARTS